MWLDKVNRSSNESPFWIIHEFIFLLGCSSIGKTFTFISLKGKHTYFAKWCLGENQSNGLIMKGLYVWRQALTLGIQ